MLTRARASPLAFLVCRDTSGPISKPSTEVGVQPARHLHVTCSSCSLFLLLLLTVCRNQDALMFPARSRPPAAPVTQESDTKPSTEVGVQPARHLHVTCSSCSFLFPLAHRLPKPRCLMFPHGLPTRTKPSAAPAPKPNTEVGVQPHVVREEEREKFSINSRGTKKQFNDPNPARRLSVEGQELSLGGALARRSREARRSRRGQDDDG